MNDESTEVALLLAPMGRDAIVLQQLLQDANISCSRCESIGELTARLSDKTTFVIITEEVLISADLQVIAGWIGAQPSWSDLPILILTKGGDGTERNPVASRLVSIFGNVSFLERPFHPTTLVSLASTALRGRHRQYQTRAHLEELERRREELRESEERLSSILERVPVGVGLFDTTGHFVLRNPALQVLVGSVIPSRDEPGRWRAFDETGRQLEPSEYPGDRALRGEVSPGIDFVVKIDSEERWVRVAAVPFLRDGRVTGGVLVVHDITERRRAEEQIRLLIREVNHRSKNMLSLVLSIARHTAATGSEDFVDRFGARIRALAASQDLLVKSERTGVDIYELVRSQLAHFAELLEHRIKLQGLSLRLSASASQSIGMALYELATNAGKYGALATEGGGIEISWNLARNEQGEDQFEMSWTECGGPPVTPPSRTGFGSAVILTMIRMSLGANVTLSYPPTGLIWQVRCPVERVLETLTGSAAQAAGDDQSSYTR